MVTLASNLAIFTLVAALAAPALASAPRFDHSPWDRVLKQRVNAIGEVDYAAVKASPSELTTYLRAIEQVSPASNPARFPSPEDKLAYWLNAYNALVTHGVAQAYPTRSVRDLGLLFSFFRKKSYRVGGRMMSLDDIEHGILRKEFREPRIHFSIVCASLSCPLLSRDAYVPERVYEQMEAATQRFFSERRNLEWSAAGSSSQVVILSSLLKWYRADFVGRSGTDRDLIAWIAGHLPPGRAASLRFIARPRIQYRDYDWSINDPGSRSRARDAAEREIAGSA
jgi:hypothetical protein